ncbi:hypothetical protein B0J14DRAFT_687886 [Halenospora varia]|nr:hypothetical protein B0J14DRAFT_687886 [Halenospora varia]
MSENKHHVHALFFERRERVIGLLSRKFRGIFGMCENISRTLHALEDFIYQSARPARVSNIDTWILVGSLEDGIHGPELNIPVEPFNTGFLNATGESIKNFVRENVLPGSEFSYFTGDLSNTAFIVLGERSIADGTCLLHHFHEDMPVDPEEWGLGFWDDEKVVSEWMVWRSISDCLVDIQWVLPGE